MQTKEIELLETYLGLYMDHTTVLEDSKRENPEVVILDVRNAPAHVKKDQIKGAIEMPVKDIESRLDEFDKKKKYVVYDWTAGTILGKVALLILLKNGFEAFELGCALEGWKGMNLPLETL